MGDPMLVSEPYAIQFSDSGKLSRDELPPEARQELLNVLDILAANPDAYPGRTRSISLDGKIRLYSHPSPLLQVTFELDISRRVLYLLHFVAPKVQITKPVFISYSHRDAIWLDKLKQFLQPLEKEELIRVWDDAEIQVGADWMSEIRIALKSARVAVFLVTQNLVNSDFIQQEELPALLEAAQNRGCIIFWITISSNTFADSPLARFQGANTPDKPLDMLTDGQLNYELTQIYQKMKLVVMPN